MVPDRYESFSALQAGEIENRDYRIYTRSGKYPILIMAPHGGNIELFTAEIAEWLAGEDFALYVFAGLKQKNSRELHITSHRFDEPRALEAVSQADIVLTIHGLRETSQEFIMVGGLDTELGNEIKTALEKAGFNIKETTTRYSGKRRTNICNRGRSGKGVQLEITFALRKRLIDDADQRDRFTRALRSLLLARAGA